MCGIVGFTRDPARPAAADSAVVRDMLETIAYRGPDGDGIVVQGGIAFGHLRLAIIDVHGGQQPRVDPATGDMLVFNGEIYGYRRLAADLAAAGVNLVDRSDTEVLFRLLQRDGIAATLDRIDGMYAFAYVEGRTGRLHLARDRFGEKPLYYAERDGQLIFASEPKAVLRHPAARHLPVDPGAVATYVAFEYLPAPYSLRAGLKKLPAGHRLAFTPGRAAESICYWRPDPSEAGDRSLADQESDRVDRLEALLDESVRDRLIADVPVGVFLSGGIDSSLIAAFVGKHAPGLTAFTVSMPDPSYDETPAARSLTRHLGLEHQTIMLDDAALIEAFDNVTARMDEPLADASLLPTWVVSRAARCRVTVALGGDGADELFAGYISFRANRFASLLARLPPSAGRLLRRGLSALPHAPTYMSPDFLLRQLSFGFGVPPQRQWAACMAPFAPEELSALWLPAARDAAAAAAADPLGLELAARGTRPWATSELVHLFARTYLPENILHKVDRASMYVSLEVRAPYLSRAFAEYAMSLPSRDKLRGWDTKHLLKRLALRHLPPDLVNRRKHGFAIPVSRLLRGALKARVGEALLGDSSPLHDWFRRDGIAQLWDAHQSGARDHRKKIWTLFCLATAIRNTAGPSQALVS